MLKIILVVAVCAIAAAIFLYLLLRKTPAKYYAKARSAHKLGEKCYMGKDFELAQEYYQEAEAHRLNARKLAKKGGKNA